MTNTDLVQADVDLEFRRMTLAEKMQWSEAIAGAGTLIPAAFRDRAKVLVAVEYGLMIGVHPLVAMNNIHVIEGTPTMSAALMAAQVRRAGHRLRIRSTGSWTDGSYRAVATLIRSDDPDNPFEAVWEKERAQRAKLLNKNNWSSYPEAMCKARAIAEVCRDGAVEALFGIRYLPEEMGAAVTEDGEPIARDVQADVIDADIVDAEVVPESSARSFDRAVADRWFTAASNATHLGPKGDIDGPGLRGVYLRARRAGVLDHPIEHAGPDDPPAMTVGELLDQLAQNLPEDDPAADPEPPMALADETSTEQPTS